ncbi:GNAT family N-acetyltransferase [Malaciobacter molluscorum LMG 25693]|uniref:Acetyltransferase n=1 Tax=Malaciobacter molluscorum LMG 25693 TaxID=870501 RepID=A0A2G1DKS2_9BACT|nr:N-acetyltransferase [Malaciobacter molluscorum]AXX92637.1 acetyltransferase [Malaciobacter molluscorum LMG 25693]PHO19060.1 GNAT family N-acetyltransferase [Malaciobacter molluscorum LMG 25693]
MEIKFFKPTVSHIKDMQTLVKPEVDSGKILLRTEDEMANTIRSYIVVSVDGKMAGFTALHIHSSRLAEVRSLIISKEFRGLKLGKKLVEACIEEGRKYELSQILSLTYEQGFFESIGFRKIEKEDIPEHKIWADCIRCKLFPICEEIAMVYDL